jgi:hypothetical protein
MANDHRRALAWRLASIGALGLLVILWRSCLGGPEYVVQVRFDMDPEFLAGAEVVIDGMMAGYLERRGPNAVNGFKVREGEHTLVIRKAGCESESASFTSGFGGARAVLMASPRTETRGREDICVLGWEH